MLVLQIPRDRLTQAVVEALSQLDVRRLPERSPGGAGEVLSADGREPAGVVKSPGILLLEHHERGEHDDHRQQGQGEVQQVVEMACLPFEDHRGERDQTVVDKALKELDDAARGTDNLLYPMRGALRARATLGEVFLVDAGMKIGAHFAPEVEGVNMSNVMEALRSGVTGKIIDVTDEEDGEHVEIYVE